MGAQKTILRVSTLTCPFIPQGDCNWEAFLGALQDRHREWWTELYLSQQVAQCHRGEAFGAESLAVIFWCVLSVDLSALVMQTEKQLVAETEQLGSWAVLQFHVKGIQFVHSKVALLCKPKHSKRIAQEILPRSELKHQHEHSRVIICHIRRSHAKRKLSLSQIIDWW